MNSKDMMLLSWFCSSNKKNEANFFHIYTIFDYSFVLSPVSEKESKSKAKTAFYFPMNLQEVISTFLVNVELFQSHEKETMGFVVLCSTEMAVKVREERNSQARETYLLVEAAYTDQTFLYICPDSHLGKEMLLFLSLFPLQPSLNTGSVSCTTLMTSQNCSTRHLRMASGKGFSHNVMGQTGLRADGS